MEGREGVIGVVTTQSPWRSGVPVRVGARIF